MVEEKNLNELSLGGPDVRRTITSLGIKSCALPGTTGVLDQSSNAPTRVGAQISEAIRKDPLATAQLLRHANSSFYGVRGLVGHIDRAIAILGDVESLAVLARRGGHEVTDCASPYTSKIAQHSLATAFLTEKILRHESDNRGAEVMTADQVKIGFTAGLLHDLGKFALLDTWPEKASGFYRGDYQQTLVMERGSISIERLLFGYDHVEAGEFLSHKYGFPNAITWSIRYHHEPREGALNDFIGRLARAVSSANRVAKALGYSGDPGGEWDSEAADQVWKFMDKQSSDDTFTAGSTLKYLLDERESLRSFVETSGISAE